jgi:hypothetical protein
VRDTGNGDGSTGKVIAGIISNNSTNIWKAIVVIAVLLFPLMCFRILLVVVVVVVVVEVVVVVVVVVVIALDSFFDHSFRPTLCSVVAVVVRK